jgi:hypothetical protein
MDTKLKVTKHGKYLQVRSLLITPSLQVYDKIVVLTCTGVKIGIIFGQDACNFLQISSEMENITLDILICTKQGPKSSALWHYADRYNAGYMLVTLHDIETLTTVNSLAVVPKLVAKWYVLVFCVREALGSTLCPRPSYT